MVVIVLANCILICSKALFEALRPSILGHVVEVFGP